MSAERHCNNQTRLLLKGCAGIWAEPGRTEFVFDIEDALRGTLANKASMHWMRSKADIASLIDSRYGANLPPYDLSTLIKYPKQSLAHEYARIMARSGLNPEFYRSTEVISDESYVTMRLRRTHDLYHVVTGLGHNILDECALQALVFAQIRWPLSLVLTVGFITRSMCMPKTYAAVLPILRDYLCLGLNARPLLAQRWEEGWNKPLSEWRTFLRLGF